MVGSVWWSLEDVVMAGPGLLLLMTQWVRSVSEADFLLAPCVGWELDHFFGGCLLPIHLSLFLGGRFGEFWLKNTKGLHSSSESLVMHDQVTSFLPASLSFIMCLEIVCFDHLERMYRRSI